LGACPHIVTPHAINALNKSKIKKCQVIFAPHILSKDVPSRAAIKPEHFACPMVHPITGETLSSYKKLMNNPATAETWQTVFGKDFSLGGKNSLRLKTTHSFAVIHKTRRSKQNYILHS
jgi:hypothetical protein